MPVIVVSKEIVASLPDTADVKPAPVLIPNVSVSKLIVPVPVSPAIFKSSSDAVTCASTYALIDSDDANVVALAVAIESSSMKAVTDNEPSLNVPNVKVPDAVIAVVDNVFV